MTIPALLSYSAAYFTLITAVAVLLRDRRSFIHRIFAIGMGLFAIEELMRAFGYATRLPADVLFWQQGVMVVSSLIPWVWFAFSADYARTNRTSGRTVAAQWKSAIWWTGLVPGVLLWVFRHSLFAGVAYPTCAGQWTIPFFWLGQVSNLYYLLLSILVLFNLERTVRSSIGRIRWQIKFTVLGIALLFAVRIYLLSQTLLFSALDTGLGQINALALLAANLLFSISLYRGRSLDVDVYLSASTIQNSLTILFVGLYLLAVGILAHFMRSIELSQSLPLNAFIIFLSLTVLAVLLLSDRLRRKLRLFVSRHFKRPIYDYRKVWMELARRTTDVVDVHELSAAVSKIISESLDVLSVTVWMLDESRSRLTVTASTAISGPHARTVERAGKSISELLGYLQQHSGYVDFKEKDFPWRREVAEAAPELFRAFDMRYAVALQAGGELIGILTLNDDRVGREALSSEDFLLLETLAAQLASSLQSLKLAERLRSAKEAEAFQLVSTFFVHDLKNLASRLSLTMQNLPAHFDNPEFRSDALGIMSSSVGRINQMCERLTMLRGKIELQLSECDLNKLIEATLTDFKGTLKARVEQALQPLPKAVLDSSQIHNVLTNLIMNANDAVNSNGVIHVATAQDGNRIVLSVKDNGCGMSQEFIDTSLFRPFQTTKKGGLGIGLFHSKVIVEAHNGVVEVFSVAGAGTEFRVVLPVAQKSVNDELAVAGEFRS
jgi:putative PEP-CTERM system histidine kinase